MGSTQLNVLRLPVWVIPGFDIWNYCSLVFQSLKTTIKLQSTSRNLAAFLLISVSEDMVSKPSQHLGVPSAPQDPFAFVTFSEALSCGPVSCFIFQHF